MITPETESIYWTDYTEGLLIDPDSPKDAAFYRWMDEQIKLEELEA